MHLDDATQNTGDMRTGKQFMQHIMGILTRVSLQDGEWKLEAERLQRLLPTAQNQPGALDERSLDVENHQRTTGRHGNQLEQRQPRRFATTRAAWHLATAPAPLARIPRR